MKGQSIKYVVFLVILFLLLSAAVWTASNISPLLENGLWILLVALFVLMAWKGDVLLQLDEYERAIIRRFGKVKRVGGPGWTFLIPFIETYTLADLRTQTIDVPKQQIITNDKIGRAS